MLPTTQNGMCSPLKRGDPHLIRQAAEENRVEHDPIASIPKRSKVRILWNDDYRSAS